MYALAQLEKKQIGLRLPQYLIEDIDDFTKQFSLNRTDIITEAIRAYLKEQKERLFYADFDKSCKELHEIKNSKNNE